MPTLGHFVSDAPGYRALDWAWNSVTGTEYNVSLIVNYVVEDLNNVKIINIFVERK